MGLQEVFPMLPQIPDIPDMPEIIDIPDILNIPEIIDIPDIPARNFQEISENASVEFPAHSAVLLRDWSQEDQEKLETRLNDERLMEIEDQRARLLAARERGEGRRTSITSAREVTSHLGSKARFSKRPEPERN